MQSNKAPKKTRKAAEHEVVPTPDASAASQVTAKPRTSRSSKVKKEAPETGQVKHHHKATAPLHAETASTASAPNARTAESPVESVRAAAAPSRIVTRAQIAELAYSYWVARGHAHGSAEEDWLRAEKELTLSR